MNAVLAAEVLQTITPAPAGVAPSLRLHTRGGADPLGAALREAVEMLVEAGRVRLARAGERPDLLHTVGEVDDLGTDGSATHHVHTVDRIPLRGGELVATRRWARRERRRAASIWLTHGRTAGRVLVAATVAPGERVRCLPVLSPWPAGPTEQADHAGRAAVRRELGVHPGVRLVVGTVTSWGEGETLTGWADAVDRLGRGDVRVLRLNGPSGQSASGRIPLAALLGAADLFVATGHDLAAASPGVSALAMGVPVVAVTTDSAAELVSSGCTGHVVAPRVGAVAAAVASLLDEARPSHRPSAVANSRPSGHALALRLLEVYGQAVAWPGLWRAR